MQGTLYCKLYQLWQIKKSYKNKQKKYLNIFLLCQWKNKKMRKSLLGLITLPINYNAFLRRLSASVRQIK